MKIPTTAILLGAALALGACGHDHGGGEPGTLALTVYGESFIEDGIPDSDMSDGWAITFDNFLISVGDVKIGEGHQETVIVFEEPAFKVYDLAKSSNGEGFAITSVELDGGHYDHYQYRVSPSANATAGNADQADFDAFQAAGFAVQVKGTATKGGETKTFDWGFPVGTLYNHCHAEIDVDGGVSTAELTIHGDHLFYDSLSAAEPDLAFQLIADADVDADDAITMAELNALNITGQAKYDTGALDIDNLGDYIDQAVSTMGHIAGEGHCGEQTRE